MALYPAAFLEVVDRLAHRLPQLRLSRLCRVRLENAQLGFDDLRHRPVAQALPVGQRPTLAPEDQLRISIDDLKQLGDQPALADPRHADQRHQLRAEVLANAVESAGQDVKLPLTADELRAGPLLDIEAVAGARSDGLPSWNGIRLALRPDRRRVAVFDRVLGGAIGRLSDEDPVDGRRGLEPRRRVDDVSGRHPFPEVWLGPERHERFARVDGDSHLELERRIGLVELDDRFADRDRGANGPFGVVL